MDKKVDGKNIGVVVIFEGHGGEMRLYEYRKEESEGKIGSMDEAVERLKERIKTRLSDRTLSVFNTVMEGYRIEFGYQKWEWWFIDAGDVAKMMEGVYSRGSSRGNLGVPGTGSSRDGDDEESPYFDYDD